MAHCLLNHPILLDKLKHYWIRGLTLQFFQSYLSNRKQYVFCNNTSSYTTTNGYGFPEWSVLWHLLFITYQNIVVNDIKIRLFPDDTALFILTKYIQIIFNIMKNCMVKLTEWFSCNRLTLNLTKTCYSIYHGPKNTKNTWQNNNQWQCYSWRQ